VHCPLDPFDAIAEGVMVNTQYKYCGIFKKGLGERHCHSILGPSRLNSYQGNCGLAIRVTLPDVYVCPVCIDGGMRDLG